MSAMAARQSSMASFSMANASLFPQFPLYPYVIFSNLLLLLSVVFNLLSSLYICIHIDFTCQFSILIFFSYRGCLLVCRILGVTCSLLG